MGRSGQEDGTDLRETCGEVIELSGFSPKLLVRRFVLATSFPPLLQLYRSVYRLVTAITVRMFRRYGAIKTIYLRRGGARGEILPLVSDIDFALIVVGLADSDRADLFDRYNSLVRWTTLLDKSLEVYDEEAFFRTFQTNDYSKLRFTEGKGTWKLLYGRDYVRELPEISTEELAGGFYTEIKVWWALFGWRFFQARKYSDETVTRNNVCFKTVSEVLKMDLGLHTGERILSRREALVKALPTIRADFRPFVEAIRDIPSRRFRTAREGIIDETLGFLLAHLDDFYHRLNAHPLAEPTGEATHSIDFDRTESHWGEEEDNFFGRTVSRIRTGWSCEPRSVRVCPGAYFNVDELLLMVEVEPDNRPTVEEVTRLNLLLAEEPPRLRQRIHLFLILPNAAFQIDPDDLMKSWQSILYQPCNPDIFDLLGRKESIIEGTPKPISPGPSLTGLVSHFLDEEKTLFYELLDDPAVYKLCGLDFCRIFWKTAQLIVLNRSAAKGSIAYPMTPPAISRALSVEGLAIPKKLLDLDPVFRDELRGATRDVGEFIPPALDYLREIH